MRKNSGFKASSKRNVSKTSRYIIASIIFLALSLAATHTFLNRTSVGSLRFIPMTVLVYTATLLVVLALLILATVLGRNLIKLYFERKSGQLGSGFRTKMVSTFIVLSFLPALLLFILAYTLISSSIEQWFRAPPAQMMEKSLELARQYYAEAEERAKYYAANIAGHFHSTEELYPGLQPKLKQTLRDFCRDYDLDNIRIYDIQGRIAAVSESSRIPEPHQDTVKSLVDRGILGQEDFQTRRVDPGEPTEEISWAVAPVRDSQGAVIGAILTETVHSSSARFLAVASPAT